MAVDFPSSVTVNLNYYLRGNKMIIVVGFNAKIMEEIVVKFIEKHRFYNLSIRHLFQIERGDLLVINQNIIFSCGMTFETWLSK